MMQLIQMFFRLNRNASRWLENRFPVNLTTDGNHNFRIDFARRHLRGGKILDIGGGKQPFLDIEEKQKIGAHVTGLDISSSELQRAPRGAYDEIIVADICEYRGNGNADYVVCQALLEHVPDARGAIYAMASSLKSGGKVVAFLPCRNAPFARLNLLLPESWKRRILFFLYPKARHAQGFPAYYNECTPDRIGSLCQDAGLRIVELRRYYCSSYFQFFFPLQLLWRLWTLVVYGCEFGELCETFSFAAQKV